MKGEGALQWESYKGRLKGDCEYPEIVGVIHVMFLYVHCVVINELLRVLETIMFEILTGYE